jgi:putative transposase
VRIVLEAASGASNTPIAGLLGIDRGQVRTWRKRWLECAPRLIAAEEKVGEDVDDRDGSSKGVLITAVVEEVLADEPRPGRPPTFTPEQLLRIVALACENPREESGRPITHWSTPELADEAVKRGIVESISPRSVGRFWGEADLKPHVVRPWKHNERAAEPEIFDREVRTVCECYAEALSLHEEGVHLVSTDEKSSISRP